ncbi:unnamed protein product, partial [marine sediment metagenome]
SAVAGSNQVTDAGYTPQRPRHRSQSLAQSAHLGKASGDEGGLRIIAIAQAITYPGTYANNIF